MSPGEKVGRGEGSELARWRELRRGAKRARAGSGAFIVLAHALALGALASIVGSFCGTVWLMLGWLAPALYSGWAWGLSLGCALFAAQGWRVQLWCVDQELLRDRRARELDTEALGLEALAKIQEEAEILEASCLRAGDRRGASRL